jgi:acyl-CoA thioesterase-1
MEVFQAVHLQGGLNRAEWSLSDPGIDLIILGMGANDMLRGIQPVKQKII